MQCSRGPASCANGSERQKGPASTDIRDGSLLRIKCWELGGLLLFRELRDAFPEALRSFLVEAYFTLNSAAPSEFRSALHRWAAFIVSLRASALAAFAFDETQRPNAFAPLGPVP